MPTPETRYGLSRRSLTLAKRGMRDNGTMEIRIAIVLLCSVGALSGESAAGLKWAAPAGWKTEAARPMRAATYTIPATAGDKDTAECAVYFFGAGQGGGIEMNIERWKGQVVSGGKPAAAKTSKRTIHGLSVPTVDASGDYTGRGGPMAEKSVKSGYRLGGAVIGGPGGNVFVKLTGPAKTVAANEQKFEQLLASFDKER